MNKKQEILDELKTTSNKYINEVLSIVLDNEKSNVIKILDYSNQIIVIRLFYYKMSGKIKIMKISELFFKIYDKENKIREMNQIFYDIIGIKKDEIKGESTP
ncbi:MAG: hypothetical protein Q9M97_08125 [Candidatus Gracilibacteria bacterium]|nr:hypothetical protein [Candidatus Gracilibacteria bacterium]